MFEVKTIDRFDLTDFAGDIFKESNTDTPDAILVRSSHVNNELISKRLLVIARAGTGVNTINLNACTANGTAVFNTPGVNANAVKELIIQNLFRCVRPLEGAVEMMENLKAAEGETLQEAAEAKRGILSARSSMVKQLAFWGWERLANDSQILVIIWECK
ncbi:hypothetical protein [Lentilactobacillus rapi]|uniref:hypothetical protein n=1 Tax=Lentilactobacillus rapi TaxID=481723 RepID=UPI000AC79498|nr:hypothetical protein [Lentilactobacillus rapi]